MGKGFKAFVEWGTDCTYVPVGTRCAACRKRIGFFSTGFWSVNAKGRHIADGVLCTACYEKTGKLLKTKAKWMPKEMRQEEKFKDTTPNNFSELAGADIVTLFEQKELCDQAILSEYGKTSGGIFLVKEAFQIEPTAVQVGVARSKKLHKKMVVFGSVEEGAFKKGDRVQVDSEGKLTETTAIEVHPYDKDAKHTFEVVAKANMGKMQITEGGEGWLVLDMEWGVFPDDRVIL